MKSGEVAALALPSGYRGRHASTDVAIGCARMTGTMAAEGRPWPGIQAVRDAVDGEIETFLDHRAADAPDPCLRPLVEIIRTCTGGGKRLPPLFCVGGWMVAGGAGGSPVILRAGAALELFHTFAGTEVPMTRRSRPRSAMAGERTWG
jgi:hypothetical protein